MTTAGGVARLGAGARGLVAGQTTTLEAPGRTPIEVTATPCRHGPPLSRPVAGAWPSPITTRAGRTSARAEAIERELAGAPDDVRRRVRWLPLGVPTDVAAEPELRAPPASA